MWIGALLAAATLLPEGCGGEEEADGLTRLRVSLRPYFSNGPLLLAEAEGYFTDEGLDLEMVEFPGGSVTQVLPPLLAGKVDVLASSVGIGVLNAMGQGARVRFVADKGHLEDGSCSTSAIVARGELVRSGEVRTVADLAGRRIALGTDLLGEFLYETALERSGLSPGEAERISLPTPSLLEGLNSGAVDAVSTLEPWLTHLQDAGHEILLPAEDVLPGQNWAAITYGPRLLDEEPELGHRFMRAYLRGVRRFAEGKTPRNLDVLTERTGMDRALLERLCWPAFRLDGRLNTASVMTFQDWALRKKLLDHPVTAREFWDGRFVEAASLAEASSPLP